MSADAQEQVTAVLSEPSDWVSYEIEAQINKRLLELQKELEENVTRLDEINAREYDLRRERRALFNAQQAIWREAD